MIAEGEVRRIAGALGVDPRVIDHDYVLGCFLHFLGIQDEVRKSWIFKGGTSLAKCHFEEYRFSEDLDFTAIESITEVLLVTIVNHAKEMMQETIGIQTDIQSTKIDVIQDDYGLESFEAKIYYCGPWDYGGSPRSLQVHINREEMILFPAQLKSIHHRYSDNADLPGLALQVYSLEEILVEKLRAFSGQRRFAIARDIYDIFIISKRVIDIQAVFRAFPKKCEVKGINVKELDVSRVKARKSEYEINWNSNLNFLVPDTMKVAFDEAWEVALGMLNKAINS